MDNANKLLYLKHLNFFHVLWIKIRKRYSRHYRIGRVNFCKYQNLKKKYIATVNLPQLLSPRLVVSSSTIWMVDCQRPNVAVRVTVQRVVGRGWFKRWRGGEGADSMLWKMKELKRTELQCVAAHSPHQSMFLMLRSWEKFKTSTVRCCAPSELWWACSVCFRRTSDSDEFWEYFVEGIVWWLASTL